MKQRLDEFLVQNNYTETRSQARHLIKDGVVSCNNKVLTKPGHLIPSDSNVKIEISRDLYVSRGAYKLEAAIKEFQILPKDKIIADIGASTGGFTDYLLQQGAKKIYAIDVGSNQLAEKLKSNPKVINLEKTDIRNLTSQTQTSPIPPLDLCVVDLSFISLKLVLPQILSLLKPNKDCITLIKPQFEGGPNAVNENGIVKKHFIQKILNEFTAWCQTQNIPIQKIIESPIKGKKGNTEYLAHIKTPKKKSLFI